MVFTLSRSRHAINEIRVPFTPIRPTPTIFPQTVAKALFLFLSFSFSRLTQANSRYVHRCMLWTRELSICLENDFLYLGTSTRDVFLKMSTNTIKIFQTDGARCFCPFRSSSDHHLIVNNATKISVASLLNPPVSRDFALCYLCHLISTTFRLEMGYLRFLGELFCLPMYIEYFSLYKLHCKICGCLFISVSISFILGKSERENWWQRLLSWKFVLIESSSPLNDDFFSA